MSRETLGIAGFVTILGISLLARRDPTSSFSFHPKPAPAEAAPTPAKTVAPH